MTHGFQIYVRTHIKDFDSESLRVQADCHGHRELEGLQVDLRADIRDLADGDAAKLNRRSRRKPTDRVLEDELVDLRMARRRIERFGPVAVQGEDGIFLG